MKKYGYALLSVLLVSLVLITGCGKKEKNNEESENFKIKAVYHYQESFQDTLYIVYESKEEVKESTITSKDNNEYKATFASEETEVGKIITKNNGKALLYYIGKQDYTNKELTLRVETENDTYKEMLDLSKVIDYKNNADFAEKYNK